MKVNLIRAEFETFPLSLKNRIRVFLMLVKNGKMKIDVTMQKPNVTFIDSCNKTNTEKKQ